MIQPELQYYLEHFYGYGRWDSDYYFIGIEEGGGRNDCLVDSKISNLFASKINKHQLTDNYDFQITKIPLPCREAEKFFVDTIQTTWAPFIKMLLMVSGTIAVPTNHDILQYQINSWGRILGEPAHAVIELLPLPSPGLGHWVYDTRTKGFTSPYNLINRDHYLNLIIHDRIQHLANQIKLFKPRLVVFYVKSNPYLNFCREIVHHVSPAGSWMNLGILLKNVKGTKYSAEYCKVIHSNGTRTLFVICNQPSGIKGSTALYFDNLIGSIDPLL